MPVDAALLEILACPKCKGELVLVRAPEVPAEPPEESFVCKACRLVYRIEDDIPNFLVDEARPYDG